MSAEENEEQLLRSVALQNAQSILLARRRAERELIEAKEALERKTEELAHSLAMMRATLESTTDGILVVDQDGKVTGFNEKFVEMWWMPREMMNSPDDQLLAVACRQLKDPEQFMTKVRDIYATSPAETFDVLEFVDGPIASLITRIRRRSSANNSYKNW